MNIVKSKAIKYQSILFAKNILLLVGEFLKSERLTGVSMAILINVSDARRYIHKLKKEEIIYVSKRAIDFHENGKTSIYRITNDTKRIERFMDSIKNISEHKFDIKYTINKEKRKMAIIKDDINSARRMHLIADDQLIHVRKSDFVVHRHPLDIALFGMGPAPSLSYE